MAALIAMSMTGQKYHYRLTELWQYKPPQLVSWSDGYRFAPYLAAFYRFIIKTVKRKIFFLYISFHYLQMVLAHLPLLLFLFEVYQLKYLGHRILNFQSTV